MKNDYTNKTLHLESSTLLQIQDVLGIKRVEEEEKDDEGMKMNLHYF